MSKRAEQRALEAYPQSIEYYPKVPVATVVDFKPKASDLNMYSRQVFIEGYEQAEKDTVERVVAWLKIHAEDYIVNMTSSYPDAPFEAVIGGKCWEDMKKALDE